MACTAGCGSGPRRIANADCAFVESCLPADVNLLAIEVRATSASGGEQFIRVGIVNYADLNFASDDECNGNTPDGNSVDKASTAVDRVDHPETWRGVINCGGAAFLSEESIIREQ